MVKTAFVVLLPWVIGAGIYAATSGHTHFAVAFLLATVVSILYIAD